MNQDSFFKIRIWFIAFITIAIVSLLAWNYTHGGVPRHHILANKDLPEISNGWGIILLPLLTWFLSYRIQKRIFQNNPENKESTRQIVNAIFGFTGAMVFGILLSTFFALGYGEVTGNMMLIIFPLALFVPLYRAEYLLGFVIGMTFRFGAVLPTAVGSILVLASAILYLYIRSTFFFIVQRFKHKIV